MAVKRHLDRKGQAVVELAIALPFLVWLIAYTLNAFIAVHQGHIGQKYAAMNLWRSLNHRSKFVMDDFQGRLHNQQFMAYRFRDANGNLPQRKIDAGLQPISNVVGICREAAGKCAP